MRRRRRLLIVVGVLLTALLLVLFWPGETKPPEPRYEGRTLSEWIHKERVPGQPGVIKTTSEVEAGVRHIGTNALPILLRWISYDPTPFSKALANASQKLPRALRPRFLNAGDSRVLEAVVAFYILGPAAKPAVPDLARLAITSRGKERPVTCIEVLCSIGPTGLPGLLTVVTNAGLARDIRRRAVSYILTYGSNAAPAIPAFVSLLGDKDEEVAATAAHGLGMLPNSQPDLVVPALTARLQSTNANLRAYAAGALGSYGNLATSAVPLLKAVRQLVVHPRTRDKCPPPDSPRGPHQLPGPLSLRALRTGPGSEQLIISPLLFAAWLIPCQLQTPCSGWLGN